MSEPIKSEAIKSVPKEWRQIMDNETVARMVSRITLEILERDRDLESLAVVGIRTGGEHLAKRIQQEIETIEKIKVPCGIIDITLYRDDLGVPGTQPLLRGTDLPFRISGSHIVLVDDVLFTGRTIRAALDAIIDFGRPRRVELAVLCDRGHRELPVRADYVGKTFDTDRHEMVRVRLSEMGYKDGVYVVPRH